MNKKKTRQPDTELMENFLRRLIKKTKREVAALRKQNAEKRKLVDHRSDAEFLIKAFSSCWKEIPTPSNPIS
jgi:hypothetical protein